MIEFAKNLGQSVIVLNPNMSKDPLSGQKIANCSTMIEHTKYVWDNFLTKTKCPAQSLSIVAHSAGGRCVAALYKDYKREMLERVRCLVFTDALYHAMFKTMRANEINQVRTYSIHFKRHSVGSPVDVGMIFEQQNGPILEVSAGSDRHELCTGKSLEAICAFMLERV